MSWDRKLTSFKCVHEYSTLICNDYILERDVIPDTEEEIELEFMKKIRIISIHNVILLCN